MNYPTTLIPGVGEDEDAYEANSKTSEDKTTIAESQNMEEAKAKAELTPEHCMECVTKEMLVFEVRVKELSSSNTREQLRNLATSKGLAVSGNKNELAKRIIYCA